MTSKKTNLNPFEEDILNPFEEEILKDVEIVNTEKISFETKNNINSKPNEYEFERIAVKLLNENFVLTALEFHMELLEIGKEIPRLKEFFSNPANFEKVKPVEPVPENLHRTSSIQTFDSLDFSRFSDEGEKSENDKIAVLEYELRKAQEKIASLRSALTNSSENVLKIENEKGKNNLEKIENVDDGEVRALNFLVNEYLLSRRFKLSAITFSEENEGQDFEDWDDVGINVSKPPDLITLFRDYGKHHHLPVAKKDAQCMTEEKNEREEQDKNNFKNEFPTQDNDISDSHSEELIYLRQKLESQKKENEDLRKEVEILKNKNESEIKEQNLKLKKNENEKGEKKEENKNDLETNKEQNLAFDSFQLNLINLVTSDISFLQNDFISVSNFQKLIQLLAKSLPEITQNTILAKRDLLLPLFLSTIIHLSSPQLRDQLLNLLFNLTKKPNKVQRIAIIKTCVAFCRKVSSEQIESELMPQCWEQIAHKYVERRLLVAESCGLICPFVHRHIRSSLVFSMIKQLLEDKEEEVREASVLSFSILTSFLETPEKHSQVLEVLKQLICDSSEKVVEVTKNCLMPAIARWSSKNGILLSMMEGQLIENLEMCLVQSSNINCLRDPNIFLSNFSNLTSCLPHLLLLLIKTFHQPNQNNLLESDEDLLSMKEKYLPTKELVFFSDFSLQETNKLLKDYFSYVNQEYFESWREHDWLTGTFFPKIISFFSNLDISPLILCPVINFLIQLFLFIGCNNVATQVKRRFEKILTFPEDENNLSTLLMSGQTPINKSITPCFLVSLYTFMCLSSKTIHQSKEEIRNQLFQILSKLLNSLCLHKCSIQPLLSSCIELCKMEDQWKALQFREVILKFLWEAGVVHKSSAVKSATSKLFECLISECHFSFVSIKSKIIPALITLATDFDEQVKVSTISALGITLEVVSNNNDILTAEIIDKVKLQIGSLMDDSNLGGMVLEELVRVLGKMAPRVETSLRNEFLLPRLTALTFKNQISSYSQPLKMEITMRLMEAFGSVMCCYLSNNVAEEVVLPGLKCLLGDVQSHASSRAHVVQSMIKEIEDKLYPLSSHQLSTQAQPNHDSSKNQIMTKIKDVKEMATHNQISKFFQTYKK